MRVAFSALEGMAVNLEPRQMVVDLVARSVRAERPTLITCMRGPNRSGLVAATALCRLGRSPHEAISLVRAARGSYALGDELFQERLRREAVTP